MVCRGEDSVIRIIGAVRYRRFLHLQYVLCEARQQEGTQTTESQHKRIVAFGGKSADAREREFERLYLESYSLVYNYVRYRVNDDAIAEDIVAEAFLNVARSFDTFDPARAKFSTWVITIAKNCMASYFRKVRVFADLDDVPERICAVSGGQDEVDDRELVSQLLACLNETEREIVVMKYREGLSNVQIADELGMNASTVSTKLARSLAKMRAVAEKGGGAWTSEK